jgi:hypothetical protein
VSVTGLPVYTLNDDNDVKLCGMADVKGKLCGLISV